MGYKVRVTDYKPVNLKEEDLMTVAEAAKTLGLSMPGVIRAIERGTLTEVIDENAGYHGRRLLLKTEVKRLARERASDAHSNGVVPAPEEAEAVREPDQAGQNKLEAQQEVRPAGTGKLEARPADGEKPAVLPIVVPRAVNGAVPAEDEDDYYGFLVLDEKEPETPGEKTATLHFINGSPPGWPETTTLPMRLGDETSGIRRAILQFYRRMTGARPAGSDPDGDPDPGRD
jgi:hypothetical protein